MTQNIFVIDAIDGAGKDTLASLLLQEFQKKGLPIFDAIQYQKEYGILPSLDLEVVQTSKYMLICEPTYVKHAHLSYRLRDHITPESTTSQRELVGMYAEDRNALYEQLVEPYLKNGGTVIQVRGLSSSLAYQRSVDPSITIDEILSQPGNQRELANAPKALVLLSLTESIAAQRRAARGEKDEPSMFDAATIQDAVRERYHSEELRSIFQTLGTDIIDIDASGDIETNKQALITALSRFF